MSEILITGATGFIGSHIAEYFCQKGLSVTCFVRKGSNLSNIKDLPVKYKFGDIEDLNSLINAFKGADFVVHSAAQVSDWGGYNRFYAVNVEGTLNVLKACLENNIKDVIITGTNSVYGEEAAVNVKDEGSPYNSHYGYFLDRVFPCQMNYYRDTKAVAEQKAIEFAKDNNVNMTVIQPVWVYGEREVHSVFYGYLKSAKDGMPFLPLGNKNKLHVIYAKDLAMAYYMIFVKKLSGINRFIIGNEQAEPMDKIFSTFCKVAAIKKPINLPKFISYPLGFCLELLYTLFKMKHPPLLTRGRVNTFYDNIEYSINKARVEVGFKNEYTLEEGIKNTVIWYRENNLL